MDYNDVKDFIATIQKTDIVNIDLQIDGVSISLKRNTSKTVGPIVNTSFNNTDDVTAGLDVPKNSICTDVLAPIVGTFYQSSSPDSPPFVKVGDKVKKGDVLFIIEAMKVINEITSDVTGEVSEVLVSDGSLLEFNQCVMRII